jgi:hypothetical protein
MDMCVGRVGVGRGEGMERAHVLRLKFKFKFKFKKLYCPNKIAFLNGKFSFAAQRWD